MSAVRTPLVIGVLTCRSAAPASAADAGSKQRPSRADHPLALASAPREPAVGAPHGNSPAPCYSAPYESEFGTRSLLSVEAGFVKPEPSYYEDIHDSNRDQPQPEGLPPVRQFPCTKCHGESGCKEKE